MLKNPNDIVSGPLKILGDLELLQWLTSMTEEDIARARDFWKRYAARKKMFDAELVKEARPPKI